MLQCCVNKPPEMDQCTEEEYRGLSGVEKVPGNREGDKSYPHTRRKMLEKQGDA